MAYWDPRGSHGNQRPDSLAVMRSEPDRGRLPPLTEAVPEIHQTNPASSRQSRMSRQLYDSPRRASQFPEARSLAPSRILNSRSRPQYAQQTSSSRADYSPLAGQFEAQYASQRSSNSDSSGNTDGFDRRSSYSSTMSIDAQPTLIRGLPPVYDMHNAYQGDPLDRINRDQYLPPIYGSGEGPSRGGHGSPLPLPGSYASYNGSQAPDYPYSMAQYLERAPFSGENTAAPYSPNCESPADYGDSRHKRRRGNLPKAVSDTLKAWFADHIAHPYPTEEEKQTLMARTGLTMSQISNWFINARRRSLPQMTRQAQAEADLLTR